jgi:CHASE1-domain containing sensor protein
MDKGGIMKRVVIAVAAVVSLVFALTAFAVEGIQPQKETGISFEQMKANHLKKLDGRMDSLQQEKICVQAAKNHDDLMTCRSKHRADMKGYRDEMRKGGGPYGPGGQVSPPVK